MENNAGVGGGAPAVIDRSNEMMIASDPGSILARGLSVKFKTKESIDRKGNKVREIIPEYRELFHTKLDQPVPGNWRLKAGDRMFAGGGNKIAAYDLKKDEPVWDTEIKGEVYTMLAADDRLFVVTSEGMLHCFGAEKPPEVANHSVEQTELKSAGGEWPGKATEILKHPGAAEGYALVLGVGSGRLIEELLLQSELHIIAVDSDEKKVEALQRKMDLAGLYGSRFSAFTGDPATEKFPPYLCNLITSEDVKSVIEFAGIRGNAPADHGAKILDRKALLSRAGAFLETIFNALRPYGGIACIPTLETERWLLFDSESEGTGNKAFSGNLDFADGFTIISRNGPLPETDDWTHQYANAAQTVVSRDGTVKAPFGVLWFGGPSHAGILPRHGHGPSPQVAGGRLFIEGADLLRAVDVYTGRLLWERELPGFGDYYDETGHFPGAGEIGSNYVSLPDRVYAVYGDKILALNAGTGETEREFKLPAGPGGAPAFFGYLAAEGDFLVATSTPIVPDAKKAAPKPASKPADGWADAKVVIARNATWQYLAEKDPDPNWNRPGYSPDKNWKTGTAGFGYGDGDDKTVIEMRNKFARVYLRTEIAIDDISDIGEIGRLALSISYDDGFIAYLNGKEILRKNVGKGAGAKASGIGSHEAGTFETLEIANWKPLIREGANVLAIEGHNRDAGSSDFSLNPILLARSGPAESKPAPTPVSASGDAPIPTGRFASGSRRLVVFDRHSGDLLWEREAEFNFRHNNIAVAGDRLFCIDKLTTERATALARRGLKLKGNPALYALDLKTGGELWKHSDSVFGTFLNYSAEHDILLQAGSKYRDRATDDIGRGMIAFRGRTGEILWAEKEIEYSGPCLIWHDRILTNGAGGFAVNLLTGEKTGWTYAREYGCNTAVGSEHLLTFRSGAAGFFDLENESGTGNLGGFRSSCTNNLIAANGVLNAPDYTRTCSCSYQNQTSLALIHMPEAEFWTFGGKANPDRIGINFGAPGDRRSAEGTLFCEYPNTGSRSDEVDVRVEGEEVRYPRAHAAAMAGGPQPWLTASAIESAKGISIDLPGEPEGEQYTVRLWFAETDAAIGKGERVFDVEIEGETVIEALDLAAEAESRIGLVKEFSGIAVHGNLQIEFKRKGRRGAILSAVEVVKGE